MLTYDPESLLIELARSVERVQSRLPRAVRKSKMLWAHAALEELRVTIEQFQIAAVDIVSIWRQAEHERENLEDLFSLVTDGYIVTDKSGLILEASASALSMLNVPARFAEHKPLAVYIFGEDRSIFRSALSSLARMASGGDWTLRLLPRGASTPRLVHASARVTRDESNRLAGVRWLLRDVTEQGLRDQELLETRRELTLVRERAHLLRELAEQRARLALAMAAAEMGHWEWDLDSGLTRWDPVHNRIMGLPLDHSSGSFDEFIMRVHQEDRPQINLLLQRVGELFRLGPVRAENWLRSKTHDAADSNSDADADIDDVAADDLAIDDVADDADLSNLAARSSFEVEFRTVHPSGVVCWAMVRGRAFRDRDGRRRVIGVIRDITIDTEAQETLLRANEQLEEQIRQRTRVLMNTQMQLQSLAAELPRAEERERRRIAAGLHDRISQPLAMARLTVGQLRYALGKPPDSGNGAGTSRLTLLAELDSLLGKAIDESRTLTFELSPPILHELGLRAALEWLVEQMHRRHGLRIDLDVRGKVDHVAASADVRGLAFQAARELLTNTVKHARATHAVLRVRSMGTRQLRLTVVDNGLGFELPTTGSRTQGLSGFGLFHLKTRVEQIGGRLRVRSRRGGHGTAVSLIVPVVNSPQNHAPDAVELPDRALPAEPIPSTTNHNHHEKYHGTHRRRSPDRATGIAQPAGQSSGPDRRRGSSRRQNRGRDEQGAQT